MAVGCSLGEILCYTEGGQREHEGLRELPVGLITQCPGVRAEVGLGDAGSGSRAGKVAERAPVGAEGLKQGMSR